MKRDLHVRFCEKFEVKSRLLLFPALAGAIYGSSCKAENEISNVVNYRIILCNLRANYTTALYFPAPVSAAADS